MNDILDNGGLCQNCQAPLGIPDGSGFASCEYCGSTWNTGNIKRSNYSYQPVIDVNDDDDDDRGWGYSSGSMITGYSYTPPQIPQRPSGRKWFK